MKSIFARILLLFTATLLVCLAGIELTNRLRYRFAPEHKDFFSDSLSLQAAEASHAYETGGKDALREYFTRLERMFPGHHTLVDRSGIDVLTGRNRSADLRAAGPHWTPGSQSRMIVSWPTQDRKYRVLIDAPAPRGPWSAIPYYLWIGAAAFAFSYILTLLLGSPLRKLEHTVERFGSGDLSARAEARRQDEIGKLARSFNLMAERIETLLTAERRLLQDVSHELRSPLARLEFAIELARTSPDRGKALDRIKKETDRLGTLVSELLQVTRAENDPQSRNLAAIPLRALIEDVINDTAVESQARRVSLRLDAPEALQLDGDRELLRRAVENVLRNAIRFAPEETSVDIALRRQNDRAIVAIRDYGQGVPDDNLSNLFKPFFRVEADRNRDSGGVGLGLSIAQRAVAIHQGGIRARNAQPGLLVEIELPGCTARTEIKLSEEILP
jgi:two-component system sensor histidine kinase CpxA